ncbi:MAG: CobD/CbiB family protein [Pseudomonadota bacterium]|uniref:CobD/CbiB family protein n=1 Tax=Polaromonas sp. TaxID=1869339 RepID=UPI00184F3FB8|nr:CobD/CbiB family protein [Polaromonas sp.]MBA3594479.1 CobD/CbiB family protein [Polaromonas sp.]MDQ3271035.1 CobD/CbiB family protein [Pseudomonadota bacterium]
MSFFAVLFALIIEQARPLARGNAIHASLRRWARWASRSLDAGKPVHGWVAWGMAVLAPALVTLAMHWLLWSINVALAFLWSVAVLYVTLGFRQFSHYFTDIRDALDDGDEITARELLAQWRQVDASELPRSEIVRHVIEYSVLAAHRHVFGVLAWFSVLAALGLGPAGAVLYRLSEFVARYWAHKSRLTGEGASPALQQAATRAWHVIDYVPARLTSLGFAVVGSFEDAIDGWRNYAQRQPVGTESLNDGVILAATSGAVNVRLGGEALKALFAPGASQGFQAGAPDPSAPEVTESTPGREPEVAHLRSIVGLVWRSVVLWMVLLALLTLARLLG